MEEKGRPYDGLRLSRARGWGGVLGGAAEEARRAGQRKKKGEGRKEGKRKRKEMKEKGK
jgi:hypothetical protein